MRDTEFHDVQRLKMKSGFDTMNLPKETGNQAS